MMQGERWLAKHAPKESFKDCNWIRHDKRLMKGGEMKEDRVEKYKELMALIEKNKRVNQYI